VEWLQLSILGNPLQRWLIAAGAAAALLLLVRLVSWVIAQHFRPIAARSPLFIDDALVRVAETTNLLILAVPALNLGLQMLALPPLVAIWLYAAAVSFFLVQVAIWGSALITLWIERYRVRNLETNAAAVGTARVLSFIARLVLFSVLLLLALDNIPGVEITALVASLGIGGIAVALALQNILGDLFASLSITLDKPFVLGDFIAVDDMSGTVESIGLKTTRLRGLGGEQLIFSNADLLSSRIRNLKRMEERRVLFTIGVAYETDAAQLREIPAMLRAIVEAQPDARFDRAHFARFSDFDLDFEVVYFMRTPDYMRYMDTQQAINLAIVEQFRAAGIDFAYPTQQIHLSGSLSTAAANGQPADADGRARPRPDGIGPKAG